MTNSSSILPPHLPLSQMLNRRPNVKVSPALPSILYISRTKLCLTNPQAISTAALRLPLLMLTMRLRFTNTGLGIPAFPTLFQKENSSGSTTKLPRIWRERKKMKDWRKSMGPFLSYESRFTGTSVPIGFATNANAKVIEAPTVRNKPIFSTHFSEVTRPEGDSLLK